MKSNLLKKVFFGLLLFPCLISVAQNQIKWLTKAKLQNEPDLINFQNDKIYAIEKRKGEDKEKWDNYTPYLITFDTKAEKAVPDFKELIIPNQQTKPAKRKIDGIWKSGNNVAVLFTEYKNDAELFTYIVLFDLKAEIIIQPKIVFKHEAPSDHQNMSCYTMETLETATVCYNRDKVFYYKTIDRQLNISDVTGTAFIHGVSSIGFGTPMNDGGFVKVFSKGDYENTIQLLRFDRQGVETLNLDIQKSKDREIDTYRYRVLNDTALVCASLFLDNLKMGIGGIAIQVVNLKTGKVSQNTIKYFTEKERKEMVLKSDIPEEMKTKEFYLPKDFSIKTISTDPNSNSVYITLEYSDYNAYQSAHKTISTLKYNLTNKTLDWSKHIYRKQSGPSPILYYMNEGKICYYYQSTLENNSKTTNDIEKGGTSLAKGQLCYTEIDKNGKISKKFIGGEKLPFQADKSKVFDKTVILYFNIDMKYQFAITKL